MTAKDKNLLPLIGILALLTVGVGLAADEEPAPVPTALENKLAVYKAVAQGVEFLRQKSEEGQNGLILQPGVQGRRKLKGYETYTVRYREVINTYEQPIYRNEWEYETYEVQVYRKLDSDDVAKTLVTEKRRRRKLKRRTLTGHKTVTTRREVRDKNGAIERTHKRKIFEKGRSVVKWQVGFLGYNAMGLYALLRAGLPADDPAVAKLTGALQAYAEAFGPPDATFDLAWLVAAFSRVPEPDERLQATRARLIGKLLNGQVPQGPSAGLWGPVCQNAEIHGAMFKEELRLGREIAKIKAEVKKKEKSKLLPKQQKEAEQRLREFVKSYHQLTSRGQRLSGGAAAIAVKPPAAYEPPPAFSDVLEEAVMPPLHVDYTRELTVDLESTAWALTGLREAALGGCIPERVDRPRGERGPLLPPLSSSLVISRALKAVGRCYSKKKSSWTEGNGHVIVNAYDPPPKKDDKPRRASTLPSEAYPTANAQAYSALVSLGYLTDARDIRSANGPMVTTAEDLARAGLMGVVEGSIKRPGLQANPLEFYFYAADVQRRYGSRQAVRRDDWEAAAQRLVQLQAEDGSWGAGTYSLISSSAFELLLGKSIRQSAKKDQSSPYQEDKQRAAYKRAHRNFPDRSNRAAAKIVYTPLILAFLIDAIRPPLAASWPWHAETPKIYTLRRAVERLDRERRLNLSYTELSQALPVEGLGELPALVISGPGPSAEDHRELLLRLRGYLAAGGLLVVETKGSGKGRQFLNDLEIQLQDMFDGAQAGEIPKDNELLAKWGEGAPSVLGVWTPDGAVKAIFLPLAKKSSGAVMSPARASIVLSRILQDRLPPTFLERGYPLQAMPKAKTSSAIDELFPDLTE